MPLLQSYEERRFLIFPYSQINLVDFDQVLETSAETVRISVDGTKTFVKWDSIQTPSSLFNLTDTEGPYTYDEILDILSTPEWTQEIES